MPGYGWDKGQLLVQDVLTTFRPTTLWPAVTQDESHGAEFLLTHNKTIREKREVTAIVRHRIDLNGRSNNT